MLQKLHYNLWLHLFILLFVIDNNHYAFCSICVMLKMFYKLLFATKFCSSHGQCFEVSCRLLLRSSNSEMEFSNYLIQMMGNWDSIDLLMQG